MTEAAIAFTGNRATIETIEGTLDIQRGLNGNVTFRVMRPDGGGATASVPANLVLAALKRLEG